MANLERKIYVGDDKVVSLDQLKKMSFENIGALSKSMRKAEMRTFSDNLVIGVNEAGNPYRAGTTHKLFRKGYNETDYKFAHEGDEEFGYNKIQDLHTDMKRNGEFANNQAFILTRIICPLVCFAGVAGKTRDGYAEDPSITANQVTDPARVLHTLLHSFRIKLNRDGNDEVLRGQLRKFPMRNGYSGAYGAAVGAWVQNVGFDDTASPLLEPEIFVENDDWEVEIELLRDLDVSKTGEEIIIPIELEGVFSYDLR